jgi:Rieske Fe-S protein
MAFKTPDSGTSAYLVHAMDGSVKAFSRICTHEGCEVGFNQPNQVFVCPCHGAQFDATSGAVLRSPARRPLQSFPVQLDASGNIIFTA